MSGFTVCKILTVVFAVLLVASIVWFQFWDSGLVFAVAAVFGAALLSVVLLWGGVASNGVACKNDAADMGLPYRYSFSTSCKVLDDGRWIPIDQLINNRESSGVRPTG